MKGIGRRQSGSTHCKANYESGTGWNYDLWLQPTIENEMETS